MERALEQCDPRVRVALGDPAAGVEGSRLTHRQALQAHAVASAAEGEASRVTPFASAGLVGFLTADIDAARAWVAGVLGPLAGDKENLGPL